MTPALPARQEGQHQHGVRSAGEIVAKDVMGMRGEELANVSDRLLDTREVGRGERARMERRVGSYVQRLSYASLAQVSWLQLLGQPAEEACCISGPRSLSHGRHVA